MKQENNRPGSSITIFLCLFFSLAIQGYAQPWSPGDDSLTPGSLKRLSLEELMNIDITLVSKQSVQWFDSPAAVYVIQGEDIRRSGARSLPEALRLAPNLDVSFVDSRQVIISARGFNGTTPNKLLVMIDGRSVYTTLYSGILWDVQDVFLPDVDRIEVVSGPGGSLWGANAVNGIINIITKSSNDETAKSLHVEAGGGIVERFSAGGRYGGDISENFHYRGYVKHFDRGYSILPNGNDASDEWHITQTGFRLDDEPSETDLLTFQGDGYIGKVGLPASTDFAVRGGNLLGRWTTTISERSELTVQTYFDYTYRRTGTTFGEDVSTVDVDFQHRFPLFKRLSTVWGAGFRHINDRVATTSALAFLPPHLITHLYTWFVQEDFAIREELTLTIGCKFEHNGFSGAEAQPSARISWKRSEDDFLWFALSRAVRTPSRIDRDYFIPATPPYLLGGGPSFVSENVIAQELGYRLQATENLLFNVSLFYNSYDDIRSVEPGTPLTIRNGLEGNTYGTEMTANLQLLENCRFMVGYNYFQHDIRRKSYSNDLNRALGENNDFRHKIILRSLFDVTETIQFDTELRYMYPMDLSPNAVPEYVTTDVRAGWRMNENLEVSLIVKNLLDERHSEYSAPSSRRELRREIYGKLTCNF